MAPRHARGQSQFHRGRDLVNKRTSIWQQQVHAKRTRSFFYEPCCRSLLPSCHDAFPLHCLREGTRRVEELPERVLSSSPAVPLSLLPFAFPQSKHRSSARCHPHQLFVREHCFRSSRMKCSCARRTGCAGSKGSMDMQWHRDGWRFTMSKCLVWVLVGIIPTRAWFPPSAEHLVTTPDAFSTLSNLLSTTHHLQKPLMESCGTCRELVRAVCAYKHSTEQPPGPTWTIPLSCNVTLIVSPMSYRQRDVNSALVAQGMNSKDERETLRRTHTSRRRAEMHSDETDIGMLCTNINTVWSKPVAQRPWSHLYPSPWS